MQGTITIHGDEQLISDLKRFGSDFPKVLNTMLRYSANKFRSHVKKKYLSGQMLGKRTGKTQKDIKVKRIRGRLHAYIVPQPRLANIYEHHGGAIIKPKTKKSLRFQIGGKEVHAKQVQLRRRPFWSMGIATFNFNRSTDEAVSKILDRELRKRGFM